jgi:hypothetical protein
MKHPRKPLLLAIKWESVTALSSGALAIATVVAVAFAWRQTVDAAHARTAQDYLDLRQIFLKVDESLDSVDRSKTYSESGACLQWHSLKRYWYFSETEWEVAQIDDAQYDNWVNSQLPQVAGALRRDAYRKSFLDMKDSPAGRWNNPTGETFFNTISAQYALLRQKDPNLPELRDTSGFVEAVGCAGPVRGTVSVDAPQSADKTPAR